MSGSHDRRDDDTPVLGRRRVVVEHEPQEGEVPREDSTGRLRLRLREAIERNERATSSDIRTGAWDAIARALDIVKSPRPVVLVVEDDDPTLRGYIRGLQEECDVLACRNVEEGKVAIEKAPRLDLVILDIGLPDGSGYDVAAYLRSTPRFSLEPGILVISAYVSPSNKHLFSRLPGRVSWIEKVSPDRIQEIKKSITPTPIRGTSVFPGPPREPKDPPKK